MPWGVERYYQRNSDRAPARSGTPPPQPTEVLVAVARKPGKPLLLGDPLIDCRDAARQQIFAGCILADSRFSCLANSSEERSHSDGHSILPGRRQTLRRKCDRRPDYSVVAVNCDASGSGGKQRRPAVTRRNCPQRVHSTSVSGTALQILLRGRPSALPAGHQAASFASRAWA
jgi:hypothetical protein